MDLDLGHYTLAEGVFVIAQGGVLYLPLGATVAALEFPIEVDASSGRAEGWFVREDRGFKLDVAEGIVEVAGERLPLAADDILVSDDIYVTEHALEIWLPVDWVPILAELKLMAEPREKLPLTARMERMARQGVGGPAVATVALDPIRESPAPLVALPAIDVGAGGSVVRGSNGIASATADYSLSAVGDLLGGTGRLFLNGNAREPLQNLRASLDYVSPDGDLLGLLRATRLTFGNVSGAAAPLLPTASGDLGVYLERAQGAAIVVTDTTAVEGEAMPGWEVELYRNGYLLDYRVAGEDGRYAFAEVPLQAGENRLEIRSYGPHGEERIERRLILRGAGMLPQGTLGYAASAHLQGTPNLLDLSDSDDLGLSASGYLAYGLTEAVTATAGVATYRSAVRQVAGASAGLRGTVGSVQGRVDAMVDSAGGRTAAVGVGTNLGGVGLTASHTQKAGFGPSQPVADSSLGVSLVVPLSETLRVPASLEVRQRLYESGAREVGLRNRLSLPLRVGTFSNTVEATWNGQGAELDLAGATGELVGHVKIGGLRPRLRLGYALHPNVAFTSAALAHQWELGDNLSLSAELGGDFMHEHAYVRAGLGWNTPFGTMSPQFSAATDGTLSAGVRLGFGLLPQPDSGVALVRGARSDSGSLSARVFLDKDGDGAFGSGDEPLKDVRVYSTPSSGGADTDSDGMALLGGLAPHRGTNIRVDRDTLPDPTWAVASAPFAVRPRPGAVERVEIPIRPTGEVEGEVFARDGSGTHVAPNRLVRLIGVDGATVAETRSAFDGFYLFTDVLPGAYRVELADTDVREPVATEVEIGNEGDIVRADLVLGDAPPPATPLPEADSPPGVGLHLASYKSPSRALEGWTMLRDRFGPVLADARPVIRALDMQPAMYRLIAALPAGTSAESICGGLRSTGQYCQVMDVHVQE